MTVYNVTGLTGNDDQAYAHIQPKQDAEWKVDVWNDEDLATLAAASAAKRLDQPRRNDSRKPVWPPEHGIPVMVENWGTRPVVHVWQMRIQGVKVAACGASPASTDFKSHQLVPGEFVACKHCWDRQ